MNFNDENLVILNKVNGLLMDDSQERLTKWNIDRCFSSENFLIWKLDPDKRY